MPSILKNGRKKPLQIRVSPSGRLYNWIFLLSLYILLCAQSVQLFETPWTVARQAPLFTGFSKTKLGGQWGLQSTELQEMVP